MKSVSILSVSYISLYSLTYRTRNNTVELIVRKNLLLRLSFCVFGSYILLSDQISR